MSLVEPHIVCSSGGIETPAEWAWVDNDPAHLALHVYGLRDHLVWHLSREDILRALEAPAASDHEIARRLGVKVESLARAEYRTGRRGPT